MRGSQSGELLYDEAIVATMALPNPFLLSGPPVAERPVPSVWSSWTSPGRVSIAPMLSTWDQDTWNLAAHRALMRVTPIYTLSTLSWDARAAYCFATHDGSRRPPPDPPAEVLRRRVERYSELVRRCGL